MIHVKQKEGLGTCGAVAYASILHLTELQGIRECNTKMSGNGAGTHHNAVRAAFALRGVSTHKIDLRDARMGSLFWLPLLSSHFPLYVSIKECKNGCTHAIAIADGAVYDGHSDGPVPLDLYLTQWVDYVIVVDIELNNYGKNSLDKS